MLKKRFEGWPYPIQEILDATDPPVTHRRDLYDLEPLEKWTDGRVALSGDAAHAMTFDIGQGAGQGIEDAVVLARNLANATDIPAALQTYETERKERAEYMQRLSRRVGRAGRWKNPAAVTARNLVTRAILGNPIAVKQFEKDLAYDF
jgi:2-polyprenyl-6-methoxyphenol hydroxylase-like FAD-dependent oxidoreductase